MVRQTPTKKTQASRTLPPRTLDFDLLVTNPRNPPDLQAVPRLKKYWRAIVFVIAQFFMAAAFVLFRFSRLFDECHLDKILSNWILGAIFVGQALAVGCFVLIGPFQTEILEWPCGFVLKGVKEAAVSFGAIKMVEFLTEPREKEQSNIEGGNKPKMHTLVDLKMLLLIVFIGIYSVGISHLAQPGIDITMVGVVMEMLLHLGIVVNWGGLLDNWLPYICFGYVVVMLVLKNASESIARKKQLRTQAEQQQTETSSSSGSAIASTAVASTSAMASTSGGASPFKTPPSMNKYKTKRK